MCANGRQWFRLACRCHRRHLPNPALRRETDQTDDEAAVVSEGAEHLVLSRILRVFYIIRL